MLRSVVCLAGLVRLAAADPVVRPTCGDPATKPTKIRSLRDVDWCNFDYGGFNGEMRSGHAELHIYPDIDGPHDTIDDSLEGVVYGDLDGDKRPDAAVVFEHTNWSGATGKSSTSSAVHVYTFAHGKPVLLASLPAGTPVREIVFARRTLTVTSGPDTAITTTSYRRANGTLVEVTAPTH